MAFFARLSPVRAIRDLRFFLAQRQPYELGFLALSVVITGLLLIGFMRDAQVEQVYKPDIIYVQQWRLDRSEAEILAQQKIDQAKKDVEQAEIKKQQDANRAKFQRLDDRLKAYGL